MPVNNIDNETVHIKILEDDPRNMQRSQVGHPLDSAEIDNMYHQSDMMRSLRMLVGTGGGGSVTLKTNNNAVLTDSNGILDINSIKLNIPNGGGNGVGSQGGPTGSTGLGGHKKGLSIIARPGT